MTDIYSTYEAKARFSAILEKVRRGRTVIVSYRGKPLAEIRPIDQRPMDIAEQLESMAAHGRLVRSRVPRGKPRPVSRKPGALKRFLAERGE